MDNMIKLVNKDVIGLAKDGRVIYGPNKSSGVPYEPCDIDACNG